MVIKWTLFIKDTKDDWKYPFLYFPRLAMVDFVSSFPFVWL